MSAELLRRAANQARHEADTLETLAPHMVDAFDGDDQGCSRDAQRHRAVADWLDLSASDAWAWGPMCPCGDVCDDCDDNSWEHHARKALAVARLFLGEAADD